MHPAPIGAEIGLIALWMQQLSRRVLPRAGLLNFACQATGSHSSALSRKTAAEPNAQHTLAQWYSPSCVRAPAGQAASSSYRYVRVIRHHWKEGSSDMRHSTFNVCRWSKPLGVHKGFCNPFATKAEEYDLIVTEAGLVRIEGYALNCVSFCHSLILTVALHVQVR